MPTSDDLRRRAQELKAKAAELLQLADEMDRRASAALKMDGLTTRNDNATVTDMDATNVARTPNPHRGPLASDGPMDRVVKELGLVTMRALAAALGESYSNVRSWNHRDFVPERIAAKVAKLRAARAKK